MCVFKWRGHELIPTSLSSSVSHAIMGGLSLIPDGIVLIATWMKTAYILKTSLRNRSLQPKVTMLLLRDGTVHIFVGLSIAIALIQLNRDIIFCVSI